MKLKILFIQSFLVFSCVKKSEVYKYPLIEKKPVEDNYFGQKLIDEFRNLENVESLDVERWIESEQRFYDSVVSKIPAIDSLEKEVTKYIYSTSIRSVVPRSSKDKVFVLRSYPADDNAIKMSYFDSVQNKEVVFFDTSELNRATGEVHYIDFYEPSFDSKYIILGISSGRDELTRIFIYDIENKKMLDEKIERTTLANPNWLPNGSGFFYNQLKELENNESENTQYEESRVRLHIIGDNPKKDKIIASAAINGEAFKKIDIPVVWTFPGTNKAILEVFGGNENYPSKVYIGNLEEIVTATRTKWTQIVDEREKIGFVTIFRNKLFWINYTTNPNGALQSAPIDDLSKRKQLFEGDELLLGRLIQNKSGLYLKYTSRGSSELAKIDYDGNLTKIPLPFEGALTLTDHYRRYDHNYDLYFGLIGWAKEYQIFKYSGGELNVTDIRPGSKYGNPEFLISKNVLVKSHDGEDIPLSLIYHKDVEMNGNNPTILYGYGAYGEVDEPNFESTDLVWLKRGGVYAIAHVRGGGAKGNLWHKGGHKKTKENSWKDFIACAEYLIKNKYTSPEKLAAMGASAGAITIGRAVIENPNLFKAAVISVGMLNPVRDEKGMNTVNVTEFGTSKDSLEFQYLLNMDVYHNIQNTDYPSILFTGGLNDHRVPFWQPAKAVAKFQEISQGKANPILFRISKAGHLGEDKPEKEITERFAFLFWQLGVEEFQP